jgi:hypothetical protein
MIRTLRGEGDVHEGEQLLVRVRYNLSVPDDPRHTRITGQIAPVEEEGWEALAMDRHSNHLTLHLEDGSELDFMISSQALSSTFRRIQITARGALRGANPA